MGRRADDQRSGAGHPLSRDDDARTSSRTARASPAPARSTRELTLAPEAVDLSARIGPTVRKRSIYETVVYDALVKGNARFALPSDLSSTGVDPSQMDFSRAELRFGLSDPRGLGRQPAGPGRRQAATVAARWRKQRRPRLLRLDRCRRRHFSAAEDRLSLQLPRQPVARVSYRRRATPAGRWRRPGRAPASVATFLPGWVARSARPGSPQPTASAISRSAARSSARATPQLRRTPSDRLRRQ